MYLCRVLVLRHQLVGIRTLDKTNTKKGLDSFGNSWV